MKNKITTFLTFDGRAEDAVKLYTSIFPNSKITSESRYGDGGPMPRGTLMSATFELDGVEMLALNGGPSFAFAQGFSMLRLQVAGVVTATGRLPLLVAASACGC